MNVLTPIAENIPAILKAQDDWVLWRLEHDAKRGKPTKVPYKASTHQKTSGPHDTWGEPFQLVWDTYIKSNGRYSGIGFALHDKNNIAGIDIDHCAKGEALTPVSRAIFNRFADAYIERSPSGEGLRIFTIGSLAKATKLAEVGVEIYGTGRYLTVTGHQMFTSRSKGVVEKTSELSILSNDLRTLHQALAQSPKFAALWKQDYSKLEYRHETGEWDDNRAEMGFCGMLARFCEGDELTIDRLYRMSHLNRSKWGEKGHGPDHDRTYGEWTIYNALLHFQHPYEVDYSSDSLQALIVQSKTDESVVYNEGLHKLLAQLSPADYIRTKKELKPCISGGDLDKLVSIARKKLPSKEEDSGLPTIVVNNIDLNTPTDASLQLLIDGNKPPTLFVLDGRVVRVYVDQLQQPIIEELTEDSLRYMMNALANYVVQSASGNTRVFPPTDIVRAVQDHIRLRQELPLLRGITTLPVLRPDGSILSKEGYDEQTKLLYLPDKTITIPPIPEKPTDKQIGDALNAFHMVFGQFPFEGGVDVSHYDNAQAMLSVPLKDRNNSNYAKALAMFLTPFLLPVVELVPGMVVTAPERGTGKSLLSEGIAILMTGRNAAMEIAPAQGDEGEWRKKITSILMEGASLAIFDNIVGSFNASSVSALLTSRTWKDRALGGNKNVELHNRTFWLFNGNNTQIGEDLLRKCVEVRLDAGVAEPWLRPQKDFVIKDLAQWMKKYRGELICAALTLIRAWYSRGCRTYSNYTVLGSFEQWCNITGNILNFLGFDTYLTDVQAAYAEREDDASLWGNFLAWCESVMTNNPMTVAEISSCLQVNSQGLEFLPGDLVEAMEMKSSFVRKLGNELAKQKNRTLACSGGTIKLKHAGKSSAGGTKWKLIRTYTGGSQSAPTSSTSPTMSRTIISPDGTITADFSQMSA